MKSKALFLVVAMALVLSATGSAQIYRVNAPLSQTWSCGLNSLAATLTQCKAVTIGGERHYITDIFVQTTTATSGQYAIQFGTGTNCGTGTTALFPVSGTANRFNAPVVSSAMASLRMETPLIADAGTAICVIGTATNTISIQLHGFTAQ
jgi:hypothetical protein